MSLADTAKEEYKTKESDIKAAYKAWSINHFNRWVAKITFLREEGGEYVYEIESYYLASSDAD